MSRILAIVLRQFYLMRGSVSRVLPLFVWVLVDIVLWGFITRYLSKLSAVDLVGQMLGAVLLWDFFTRVMQGITTAFFEDVWSRNFLNIFASPMRISEYVGGLVLTSIATSAIGLAAMLVLASFVFGLSFLAYGVLIVPFIMVLFLFGTSLGVISCGVVMRFGPAAEWFIWPIPGLISPFVGVFYPLSTLPAWMQAVAHALPPSYVFEAMRMLLAGQPVPLSMMAWGLGLAVLYVAVGSIVFARIFGFAVRTGLIARYSAESVS